MGKSARWTAMLLAVAVVAAVALTAPKEPTPAQLLKEGSALYEDLCQRCHGPDGGDLTYQGIKTLVDIGQRRTRQQIVKGFREAGFVEQKFNDRQVAAILVKLKTLRSGKWARGDMLVEPSWVALHGKKKDVRVVDARSATGYEDGHIPGAVSIGEFKLWNPEDRETYLPPQAVVQALIRRMGIAADTHVLIYDEGSSPVATRLWFVLSSYGVSPISIVNGGWAQWQKEKRAASRDRTLPKPSKFVAKLSRDLFLPSSQASAGGPELQAVDVRSQREFAGGSLPGAIHLDWQQNVAGGPKRWKSAPELLKLYATQGITSKKPVIYNVYCRTGGRASHTLFTLRLLGFDNVRIYYGSYTEYQRRMK